MALQNWVPSPRRSVRGLPNRERIFLENILTSNNYLTTIVGDKTEWNQSSNRVEVGKAFVTSAQDVKAGPFIQDSDISDNLHSSECWLHWLRFASKIRYKSSSGRGAEISLSPQIYSPNDPFSKNLSPCNKPALTDAL